MRIAVTRMNDITNEIACELYEREASVLNVDDTDTGERLDKFVSEQASISRSMAAKLIEDGGITVNGLQISRR